MKKTVSRLALATGAAAAALAACGPQEDVREVNIFSARHYASDEVVFNAFTEETGIRVNLVEAGGDLLIERVRADGERSPADLIITVDAGRLQRAEEANLFQPVGDLGGAFDQLPDSLKHPEGLWFGFATRARVIAYAPDRVDPSEIAHYGDIANPEFEGRVCARSSNNVYNQSTLAAMIANEGVEATEAFARGVVANMAREPQGGDTDQIIAIAAGECDVALVNHYYFARLARSDDPEQRAVAEATAITFPEFRSGGTHINVTGVGMGANAPNRDEAEEFMRFLLSDTAQRAFAELTNEIPAMPGVEYDNDVLDGFGAFNADDVNISELGRNAAEAQRIFDRAGWQ
ncbi:extracellular solute-binding protein [Glycocaulis profundi]|nr:extracellular solute-binding protein [Glycocaulis profundi]